MLNSIKTLIRQGQRDQVASFIRRHKPSSAVINSPIFEWGAPPLAMCGNVETAQLLIDHGALPTKVGQWWKPGFGARNVVTDVGRFLVESGAGLSPHAAAGIGLVAELAEMIEADPETVRAQGGDGCTPLHFARHAEIVDLLIEHGAELDAVDEDHHSTPSQWLVGDLPEVARHLIKRGAKADIFVLAALGEVDRVQQLIEKSPECLAQWVGKPPFPAIGHEGSGGTILQWSLGFNSFAHQYAKNACHDELFDRMCAASDTTTRFLVACVMADRKTAAQIAAENPNLVESLDDDDRQLLARYCWETNANLEAVRLMLDIGFPVDFPEHNHGYSPLHNAAWGGYADLVELLIERGHPLDKKDPNHGSTPLGWALHCCLEDGRHPEGEYGRVVAALIDAGCGWDRSIFPTGNAGIDAVLKQRI